MTYRRIVDKSNTTMDGINRAGIPYPSGAHVVTPLLLLFIYCFLCRSFCSIFIFFV